MYLLDANVFIQAANSYYDMGTVPGFWTWVEAGIGDGLLRSVTLVRQEIDYPGNLKEWIKAQEARGLFIDESAAAIQSGLSEIANWIVDQPFGPAHVAKFLDGADPWIVAAARVHEATVVTQEQPINASNPKKIKIPNVGAQFGVEVIDTFTLLRNEGAVLR